MFPYDIAFSKYSWSMIQKLPWSAARPPFRALTSMAFSLRSETGKSLLARDVLLSLPVLESHYSPNRAHAVTIVGIVVVQGSPIPGVDDPDIVGVPSVGRQPESGRRNS